MTTQENKSFSSLLTNMHVFLQARKHDLHRIRGKYGQNQARLGALWTWNFYCQQNDFMENHSFGRREESPEMIFLSWVIS